jgi:transcriptional regulator GlxA family with amidase domain
MRTLQVALLLFENCELLDVAGPASAFNFAARLAVNRHGAAQEPYETRYYSRSGGPVRTIEAACIDTLPVAALEEEGADTLIVAGGPTQFAIEETALANWIGAHRHRFRRIGSVCTGAYLLARAGLLEGRRAATHWEDCDEMAALYPAIDVDRDAIFVADEGLWTCAGASSGIDMTLAMIEQDYGHDLAFEVAQAMVVFLKRDSSQAQLSTLLQSQSAKGQLEALLVWIAQHPACDLSVEALAARANMSVRNFYRSFERQTGLSPGEWVERCRLEAAVRLLEQSDKRVEQIALESGFGSYERLRRAFVHRFGSSPASYRKRRLPERAPPEPQRLAVVASPIVPR